MPSVPGGGTVVFVSPTGHSYNPDPAVREEAGTPAIVESIRAGLVFALKEAVGAEEIRRRESAFARRALASWGENPNLRILGNPALERLAIVSLGIRHPRGMLHSNFVVALLSDLFGIQARSGCFCAGPYIHRMYPIDPEWSAAMHAEAVLGRPGAKLGFTRLSFNYFISEAVFDYIVEAVHLLANEGWKLLPLYRFDAATGLWQHASSRAAAAADAGGCVGEPLPTAPESVLARQLEQARRIIGAIDAAPAAGPGRLDRCAGSPCRTRRAGELERARQRRLSLVFVARSRPARSIVTTRSEPRRTVAGIRMRTAPRRASPVPRATTRPRRVTVTRAARMRELTASLSVQRTRTRLRRTLAGLQTIVAPLSPAPGSPLGPGGPGGPPAPG